MQDIGLFEAIYSARSLRRLKPDPVPEELITKVLDASRELGKRPIVSHVSNKYLLLPGPLTASFPAKAGNSRSPVNQPPP